MRRSRAAEAGMTARARWARQKARAPLSPASMASSGGRPGCPHLASPIAMGEELLLLVHGLEDGFLALELHGGFLQDGAVLVRLARAADGVRVAAVEEDLLRVQLVVH